MSVDELAENFSALVKSICSHRPVHLGKYSSWGEQMLQIKVNMNNDDFSEGISVWHDSIYISGSTLNLVQF